MKLASLFLTRPFRLMPRRWGRRLAASGAALVALSSPAFGQTNAHWTGGTGNWTTVTDWDTNPNYPNNGTPAGSTYNAFLDGLNGSTAYIVTLNSAVTVSSLTISSSFATLSHTSGIFQTTTGTISAGTYLLNGGEIQGGTWTISGTGSMKFGTSTGSTLDGVTFASNSGIDLSGTGSYVRLINGTTFAAGTALSIGNSGALGLGQTTLSNVAITLNSNSYLAVEGNTTTTLSNSVTVSQAASTGGNLGAGFNFTATGNLTNQGTIQVLNASATTTVNPSGSFTNSGTLKVGGATAAILNIAPGGAGVATGSPTWTNTGSMVVDANGTLNLGGRMTTAGLNLPGISRLNSGGTINITGPLDNTVGGPLALTTATGSFGLAAGTISGGSITATGGATLIPNTNANNQLSGVTIGTGAVLNLSATSTYVRLTNGSTFAAGSTVTVGNSAGLGIAQTQTVDNVAVTLNSNSYLAVEGATSAVLGSGVTVSQAASTGGNLGAGFNFTATGNLTNQGTIQSLNTSSTRTVTRSGSFCNSGTLKVGGATAAILIIAPGGAGVATGSPTWTNTGSMVVDANGTLNLGGRMTTAGLNLPGISRLNAGGTINITGPLDNTAGGPLALTTATGSFGLAAGTISGGSITATGEPPLIPNTNANNQLSGVTIGTGAVLNLSATSTYVRLTNGSTFAAGSTVTVGNSAGLGIAQTQTVDNVAVTLNSNSYLAVEGAISVVLGSGVTVSQAASTGGNIGSNFNFSGTGNLANQGTIQSLNATSSDSDRKPVGVVHQLRNSQSRRGHGRDSEHCPRRGRRRHGKSHLDQHRVDGRRCQRHPQPRRTNDHRRTQPPRHLPTQRRRNHQHHGAIGQHRRRPSR